jgi:hypothetical protein
MRRPFHVHFTTAEGTSNFHELHWPPNSEALVQTRMAPRLHYRQHEIVFGFIGDKSTRPLPLSVVNTFIARGKRRTQSPEDDEAHAVDHNDNYHVKETRECTRPNVYTLGFRVQTRQPGRYPVRLEVITECGEGKPVEELIFIVEDRSGRTSGATA